MMIYILYTFINKLYCHIYKFILLCLNNMNIFYYIIYIFTKGNVNIK